MAMHQPRLSLQGTAWGRQHAALPVLGKAGGGQNSLSSQQHGVGLWGLHLAGRQLCVAETAFLLLLPPFRRARVCAPWS